MGTYLRDRFGPWLVNTELIPINCVKSSADKDDFDDTARKSKTNVVSLSRKTIDLWQFISNQYQH